MTMVVPAAHLTATFVWGLLFVVVAMSVAFAAAVAAFETRGHSDQAAASSTERTELRRAA
jgi:hypothetical protein